MDRTHFIQNDPEDLQRVRVCVCVPSPRATIYHAGGWSRPVELHLTKLSTAA